MSVSREDVFYLYKCILGREPESEHVVDQLVGLDFDDARSRLLASDEAISVVDGFLSTNKWKRKASLEDVLYLYEYLLRRPPENDEVVAEKMKLESLEATLENFLDSEEFFEKKYRVHLSERSEKKILNGGRKIGCRSGVLLIGAYGNGNMGDSDQAQFLASYLLDIGLSGEQIFSVSWESTSDYPFIGKKLPRECLFDFELLSSFSAIFIGGGGLLGVEHYPLTDLRWIDGLKAAGTPYFLVAVGASRVHVNDPFYHDSYLALLNGCQGVSARDNESVLALSRFRNDVIKVCDPVIKRSIDEAIASPQISKRLDIILRYPLDDQHREFIDGLKSIYTSSSRNDIRVIFVEPFNPLEMELLPAFPGHIICSSVDDLGAEIRDSAAVLSMRFHGCAPAIKYGLPLLGFGSKKIKDLFDEIGLADSYWLGDVSELLKLIEKADWSTFKASQIRPGVALKLSNQYSKVTKSFEAIFLKES